MADRSEEGSGDGGAGDGGGAPGGSVLVVGPGRVGQSVAAALAGDRAVSVAGRGEGPPDFLERFGAVGWVPLGTDDAPYDPGVAAARASRARPREADTLVFCVPDDALPGVAAAWADAAPRPAPGGADPSRRPAPVALHTSGVHPPHVLSRLRSSGRSVGSWHPLMALSRPREDAFRNVTFGLGGEPAALERAREFTAAVGGRGIHVAEDENARYHAAAVFASNYLVACLSVARRELEAATDAEDGLGPLLPLAMGAVSNLEPGALASGTTGPLARGDVETVRRHLAALGPEAARLYRGLARELLAVVEDRLAPERLRELRRALEAAGGGEVEAG